MKTPNADGLLGELEGIMSRGQVIVNPDEMVVYECDAYTLERRIPTAVVFPQSTAEVVRVVQCCRERSIPIIPRGAGTSLSGAVLAVDGGVILSLTRMNRILEVDIPNGRAVVEAGCVNVWITQRVKPAGYLYAPDPSSQSACTIGGNIATNSGGPHTLKYGVTTNHILGVQMVTSDGEVAWFGTAPDEGEEVAGYDLRGAIIGSEGMFGIVTAAVVRLIRAPQAYKTSLAIFAGVDDASQTVSDIIGAGIVPAALEMMDQLITYAVEQAYHFGFPADAGAVLIIEVDGLAAGLETLQQQITAICQRNRAREVRIAQTEKERADLWKSRKRAFGAVGRISPNFITQDGVVPRSKLPEMMRFIAQCSEKYQLRIPNVFHAGDGNIHPLVLYDERNPDEVRRALAAGHDILNRCIELGGSVTGEHGIGVEKIDFMSKQFGPDDLAAMQQVRRVFDPLGLCNPHKIFPGSKRCADFAPRKQIAA